MSHVCTCEECHREPYADRCRFEEMEGALAEYERAGWVVIALPQHVAEGVVGTPATRDTAMVLSARVKRVIDLAEWLVALDDPDFPMAKVVDRARTALTP